MTASRPTEEIVTRSQRTFDDVVTGIAADIEQDLATRIARANLPGNLRKAVEYSALDGGKRLRPILTILCCDAVGGDRRVVFPAAAAIELIHCFSLVHDDLPAMDDDDLRRGKPTLHKHAGEAMAILAGDVMVSMAFEMINSADVDTHHRSAITAELAHATTQMIVGQVYDTLGGFEDAVNDQRVMHDRLHLIHRNKTGALIRAACRMGAIGGGADAAQIEAVTKYGEAMGLMFQIVDDLLDVTQSAEHIGKATGKDQSAGKLTFPGLLGIEGSHREVNRLRQAALDAIAALGEPARMLHDLCETMAVRTK